MKTLYKSREKVIKLFNDYSKIASKAKYKSNYGEGIKILTSKQILPRSSIARAEVKAGNTSENLLNEIRQIVCFCIEQKKLLKKYTTI